MVMIAKKKKKVNVLNATELHTLIVFKMVIFVKVFTICLSLGYVRKIYKLWWDIYLPYSTHFYEP